MGKIPPDFTFTMFFYVGGEFGFELFNDSGDDVGRLHELSELGYREFFVPLCEFEFEIFSF